MYKQSAGQTADRPVKSIIFRRQLPELTGIRENDKSRKPDNSINLCNCIGRLRRSREGLLRASLTVECAGVFPIFFIACLILISSMNAMRIQVRENLSLSNTARQMAMAANLLGDKMDSHYIDLAKVRKLDYPVPSFGIAKMKIALRARVYPWVGSEEGVGGSPEDQSRNETVYVTDNREVYHTYADCSHLDLSIIRTDQQSVKQMRNAYGNKYKKCSDFPKGYKGPVYVTEKGDYYYPSTNYGSLTRHVHAVRKEEAGGLKLCSRCAARGGKERKNAA